MSLCDRFYRLNSSRYFKNLFMLTLKEFNLLMRFRIGMSRWLLSKFQRASILLKILRFLFIYVDSFSRRLTYPRENELKKKFYHIVVTTRVIYRFFHWKATQFLLIFEKPHFSNALNSCVSFKNRFLFLKPVHNPRQHVNGHFLFGYNKLM